MFNVSERERAAGSTHRGSHARGRASPVRCRSCSGTRSGCPMPRLRSLSGGEVLQIVRVGLRLGAVIATWEPHQAPTQGRLAGPDVDPFRIIGRHSARCIPLREVAGSNARLTRLGQCCDRSALRRPLYGLPTIRPARPEPASRLAFLPGLLGGNSCSHQPSGYPWLSVALKALSVTIRGQGTVEFCYHFAGGAKA